MHTHVDKIQENKKQSASAADNQLRSGSESTFQFVDNRSKAIAQRKLQDMANNSPQVSQQTALQQMADNRPQAKQAAQLKTKSNLNTSMPIQRQVELAESKKKYSKEDAVTNLQESRKEGINPVTASWIGYILTKIKPQAGKVNSPYVSSFDTAKGGFSASRELPDVKDLVVHAHYKREKGDRENAQVNSAQVKWADNEAGNAPPGPTKLQKGKETEVLGSDHDKVAIKAWEGNPERHKMRKEAETKKGSKQNEEPLDLDWLF
jgi:hypothetical protein